MYVCCLEWDVEHHKWDVVSVCIHVHEHFQLLCMCSTERNVEWDVDQCFHVKVLCYLGTRRVSGMVSSRPSNTLSDAVCKT